MVFARRTAVLRLVAMAGLTASAVLTSDTLHPGRAFCPLETACAAARESALGTILGVPTSIAGIGAFTGLFALTLLPLVWAHRLLRPAGLLAAIAGLGFIGYQALVLHTFCPLCVVADSMALTAAGVILTWPPPPSVLSVLPMVRESGRSRAAWTAAAMLAVFLPFAWPRPEAPSWVEIAPLDESHLALLFEEEPELEPKPEPVHDFLPPPTSPTPSRVPAPRAIPWVPRAPLAALAVAPPPPEPERAPAPRVEAKPAAAAPPPVAPVAPVAPVRPVVRIVEYVNAYCAHCRATHARLEALLASTDADIRLRRIYTWAGNDYPMWARACAHAETLGQGDRMFAELLKAPRDTPQEIRAAAGRAGLDLTALDRALRDPTPPVRLVQDKRLQLGAGLRGLPTIDIERRRLMGEQSEEELREALRAATRK